MPLIRYHLGDKWIVAMQLFFYAFLTLSSFLLIICSFISQYKYTPKHILLTQEQKNQVHDEYNIPFNKYPKIFITDPMAKYYNARIGDLIKIIRPSSVSGYAVYYRYVISS